MRSFDEYRARLLENFVILERGERHDKIARELDAKAQRLQGRVSRIVRGQSGLLHEVPDLVEYPSVVGGTFALEFLELPEEVLTTTLIHHQHYFPVESEDGKLKNAFLAVINTEPDNERTIARNAERVVTARLRDARFFWEADRKATLESRLARLSTLLFHKKLGTYKEKAERIARLAKWIASDVFGWTNRRRATPSAAARLAKADLTTDMVREFPELQGTMGGIYAREEGLPEEVWKAIYFHYLPHRRRGRRAAVARSARQRGAHVGGRLAGRQARYHRRPLCRGREADRVARPVWPAPQRAGGRQDAGRPVRHGHRRPDWPAGAGRFRLRRLSRSDQGAERRLEAGGLRLSG